MNIGIIALVVILIIGSLIISLRNKTKVSMVAIGLIGIGVILLGIGKGEGYDG